jgi:hypothetical protein
VPQGMIRPLGTGIALAASLLLAGGCAPARNEKFTPANVDKVQQGIEAEQSITLPAVEAVLGPGADYRPPDGDGGLRWKRWEREKGGDSLDVGFDADGRAMKSVYHQLDKPRDR